MHEHALCSALYSIQHNIFNEKKKRWPNEKCCYQKVWIAHSSFQEYGQFFIQPQKKMSKKNETRITDKPHFFFFFNSSRWILKMHVVNWTNIDLSIWWKMDLINHSASSWCVLQLLCRNACARSLECDNSKNIGTGKNGTSFWRWKSKQNDERCKP